MLAGILPLAGSFGTAFWIALLTAGMGTLMSSYTANNAGATEASAQASALGVLAWIGVVATLITLFVALKLPKPASESPVPGTATGSTTAPGE